MKRAKIILSALGVVAVVGSALAFKAHKIYGGSLRCITTDLAQTTTDALESCVATGRYNCTIVVTAPVAYCTAFNAPQDADCPAICRALPSF